MEEKNLSSTQKNAEDLNDLIKFHQNTAEGLKTVLTYLDNLAKSLDKKNEVLINMLESFVKGLKHTMEFHKFSIERLTENLDKILEELTETIN